jgi:hypothetical protein
MESYFLCCACGSLERSSIEVDLCTRCGRRYCRAHRRTHRCDDNELLPWSSSVPDGSATLSGDATATAYAPSGQRHSA